MLFEDEELSRRRLYTKYKAKPRPILNINMRFGAKDKMVKQAIMAAVLIPFILAATGVIAWYGLSLAKKVFFSGNKYFEISNIEVDVGLKAVITETLVREHAGIKPGMNLFEVPIKKIRSDFLKNMSNIKDMEIRRRLPDTLKIRIIEREPVARIGRTGVLVADSDGYIFLGKKDIVKLPVIFGHTGLVLRPGDQTDGMTFAAIQVLEMCRDPMFEIIDIKSIDVSNKEYITLWLTGGVSDQLAWEKMGERSKTAESDLMRRLSKLSQVLQSDEGKRKTSFDSTYKDDVYAQ